MIVLVSYNAREAERQVYDLRYSVVMATFGTTAAGTSA